MANKPRTAIDDALFAQLISAGWKPVPGLQLTTWKTASQHFQHWDSFDADNQPAVFLRRIIEDVSQTRGYGLNKYVLRYEVWIYVRTESNDVSFNPYSVLDPIVDAVDAALAVNPVTGRNTLCGLVDNCRISGQIAIADGTDNGQAVIRIPVEAITGS